MGPTLLYRHTLITLLLSPMSLILIRWENLETKTKEECRFQSQIAVYCIYQDAAINGFHAECRDNFLRTIGKSGLNHLKDEFKKTHCVDKPTRCDTSYE